ncbi:dTMP kinase [Helicobacter bilis]|uniref:dTMP kinase n=1 Tax=Helicobacter bilis TaxID=37372 RepID=UPI00248E573B|nr:dTMP kinase [Helicobacter bilis]
MKYYVIEGIDTSGKTTQCNLIKQNYPCVSLENYKDSIKDSIIVLNEPGSTYLGNLVRKILLDSQTQINEKSSFLLFLAQRAELFLQLKNISNTIIADRSLISGVAYAKTIDMREALNLNLFATGGILPQKIVFLETSKDTLKSRLNAKSLDNIEQKGIQYLLDTQSYFKEILAYLQDENFIESNPNIKKPDILTLDSAMPKEDIHKRICSFFGI